MALTKEILKMTEGLNELSDAQIEAIATLSKNDEDNVVGSFSRNFHDQLDKTVRSTSGIEKEGSEKSYDYAARALKALKEANKDAVPVSEYQTLKQQYESLKTTQTDPDGWKRKYEDAEATAKKLRDDLRSVEKKHMRELQQSKVQFAIENAMSSIEFNPTVPEGLRELAKREAINKLKTYQAEIDETGGSIIFRDQDGTPLTNPRNLHNPYTTTELIKQELEPFEVLAKGKPAQQGAGTKPVQPVTPETGSGITLATAANKVEAAKAINDQLEGKFKPGSIEYSVEFQKAYQANNVADLPDA